MKRDSAILVLMAVLLVAMLLWSREKVTSNIRFMTPPPFQPNSTNSTWITNNVLDVDLSFWSPKDPAYSGWMWYVNGGGWEYTPSWYQEALTEVIVQ